MSLPVRTKYDANMYRALSLFPEELEEKPLNPSEFTSHFKDFYGRPVQDIVEALHRYSQKGYFKFELTLAPEYLNHGQALANILDKLSGSSASPDKYHGLGKLIYDKVVTGQPLTKVEASALPDNAKSYLAFKLSDIDRGRLSDDLAIYDSRTSRLIIPQGKISTRLSPLDLKDVHLEPDSYDKRKGVLRLAPLHSRGIAGKTSVKRSNDKKYRQCWVMECLFKSDRTLINGVEANTILNVSKAVFCSNYNKKKEIQNTVAEINKKIAKDNGPKKLISIDGTKVKVDKSYL